MERSPDAEPQLTEPASAARPNLEDVLGRRISAALIDIGILFALFIVLAVTIGDSKTEGGSASVSLTGGPFALYVALVLLYYGALEAAIGQTVGKLLLGLEVVRMDGSRPSLGAIVVRTLLRIVDWLPLMYLVGFIALMATGARRQRLGDLAAKTIVVRRSKIST